MVTLKIILCAVQVSGQTFLLSSVWRWLGKNFFSLKSIASFSVHVSTTGVGVLCLVI